MDPRDIFGRPEVLNAELELFLDYSGSFPVLKHPLVFSVPYTPLLNSMLNAQLEQKKEAIENFKFSEKWDSFVFMYERPYRFYAFKLIQNKLADKEYWELLGNIWTDTENAWQYRRDINKFFHPKKRDWSMRIYMMDDEERKIFAQLPDRFIVYRGCGLKNKKGYSWTLSRTTAIFFAMRYRAKDDTAILLSVEVNKSDVLAYFDGRREQEIVVLPKSLKQIKTMRLKNG